MSPTSPSELPSDITLPPIDEALLVALDRIYPERCPDLFANDRSIWAAVGERRVVRMLWAAYREQQEILDL
jgi:hypothetical protein